MYRVNITGMDPKKCPKKQILWTWLPKKSLRQDPYNLTEGEPSSSFWDWQSHRIRRTWDSGFYTYLYSCLYIHTLKLSFWKLVTFQVTVKPPLLGLSTIRPWRRPLTGRYSRYIHIWSVCTLCIYCASKSRYLLTTKSKQRSSTRSLQVLRKYGMRDWDGQVAHSLVRSFARSLVRASFSLTVNGLHGLLYLGNLRF